MMLKHWLLAIRPQTLFASLGPVVLGSALAVYYQQFEMAVFILALGCAVCLQISVNLANDLFDARSGVDTGARLGPVRVTQSGLVSEPRLKCALGFTLMFAVISGLVLVYLTTWILLVFGLLSVVAVFAYSAGPYPLASHALGELCVFLFFGCLAVSGTYYAHAGQLSSMVLAYACVVGIFSAAIMLVNNIRDIPTDSCANKNTLAVRLGDVLSRKLFVLFIVAAFVVHFIASLSLGLYALIPVVLCFPFALKLGLGIFYRTGRDLNKQLIQTAQLGFFYCLLMSAVLVALVWQG